MMEPKAFHLDSVKGSRRIKTKVAAIKTCAAPCLTVCLSRDNLSNATLLPSRSIYLSKPRILTDSTSPILVIIYALFFIRFPFYDEHHLCVSRQLTATQQEPRQVLKTRTTSTQYSEVNLEYFTTQAKRGKVRSARSNPRSMQSTRRFCSWLAAGF